MSDNDDDEFAAACDFLAALGTLRAWTEWASKDQLSSSPKMFEPGVAAEQMNVVRNWLQVMLTNAEFLAGCRTPTDELVLAVQSNWSCLTKSSHMGRPEQRLWDALRLSGWFERTCARCSTELLTKADVEVCPVCEAKLRQIAQA